MSAMLPKLFVATKALIRHDGKVLILRESKGYADGSNAASYDVVGGRLTPGENYQESLVREIKEETGLDVTVGPPFYVNEWRPVVKGEEWQIVGIFFDCEAASTNVRLSEDHDAFLWIDPAEHESHPIIPNLRQVFQAYLERTR